MPKREHHGGRHAAQHPQGRAVERKYRRRDRRGRWTRRGAGEGEHLGGRQAGHKGRDPCAEPAQPRQHLDVAPARPRESINGGHEGGQQQRPGQQRQHPTRHHLAHRGHVALGSVRGTSALIERRDGAKRRASERAERVLVDRLHGAVPGRRQLTAAGDAHRVVAVLDQHPLRPDPNRERQPRELAERARPSGGDLELSPNRLPDGALQPDAGAARVVGPGLHDRAAARARREVGHHEHAVDESRRGELVQELGRPDLAEVRAIHRSQHERLAGRAALEDAAELEQRGRVRGAAGRLRDDRRVTGGHDHDLAPRAAGPPADHVHEVRPAWVKRWRSEGKSEPVELARHASSGAAVTGPPRPAVRLAFGDPGGLDGRQPAVEQDVRGQALAQRPGPALQGEHRQHERQQRRHERRYRSRQGERSGRHSVGAAIAMAARALDEAVHRGRVRGDEIPPIGPGAGLLRCALQAKEWLPETWAPRAPRHHPAGHRAPPRRSIATATIVRGDSRILAPGARDRNSPAGNVF